MTIKKTKAKTEVKEKKRSKKGEVTPRDRGRPSLLTKEVTEKFTDAISIGSSYELASRYAGISEQTIYSWLREGRAEAFRRDSGEEPDKSKEDYLNFLKAVEVAESEAGVAYQTIVDKAARIDPNWAFKMLKVRFPIGYRETDMTANIQIPPNIPTEYLDRIIAGENPLNVLQEYYTYLGGTSNKNQEQPKE